MYKIIDCQCKNLYQDNNYGPGRRVANSCQKPASPGKITAYRCTVCSKEHLP